MRDNEAMIYFLGNYLFEQYPTLSFLRLVNYLTFRSLLGALTATFLFFWLARRFIRYVHRHRLLDQVRETGIDTAFDKRGTPTMGGLPILAAVVGSLLLWGDWSNRFLLTTLTAMLAFGALGFVDDRNKIRLQSGDRGLSEKMKLLIQTTIGIAVSLAVLTSQAGIPSGESTLLYLPFLKRAVADLGWFYLPFAVVFILLVSNAVNLTDGLDGLAITPSVFTVAVLGIFAYIEGNSIQSGYLNYPYYPGAGELLVFASAFAGAGIAFLWYNAYPAQIFMGDTGSLAIGGTIAAMCLVLKQEGLFPILGGLFVAEALTSQIQDKIGIRWLGRRIFYRAPLHHGLQYKGMAETKVVIRLWIIAGICALVALATIKIR